VEKTVAAESAERRSRVFRRKKKRRTFYEAELVVNGHSKDVLIDASGAVVEVEEEVALDSLSADVKAGTSGQGRQRQNSKVESLTKKGNWWRTKQKWTATGKSPKIQVGPDGKPLGHEE